LCGDPRHSLLRSAERYLRAPIKTPLVAQEGWKASDRVRDTLIRREPEESRQNLRRHPKDGPAPGSGSVRKQISTTSRRLS
jgi:hypothetical protein